jgi:hypothetical protein
VTKSSASGCPKCGTDRLKSAPMPGLDAIARFISGKRRYRCAACGWTGWIRRLRRRHHDVPSLAPRQRPQRMAYVLFVFAAVFLVVSGAMLFRACNEGSAGSRDSLDGAP